LNDFGVNAIAQQQTQSPKVDELYRTEKTVEEVATQSSVARHLPCKKE
jgi:hypothetical protein